MVKEKFFSRELKELGKEFNEDILVVCEKFEVVINKKQKQSGGCYVLWRKSLSEGL